MSEASLHLSLPYIQPSQNQKHVTHNEAIARLDAIVQLSVTSRSQSVPPGSAAPGSRYIVGVGASGAWSGQDGQVAIAEGDTAWSFAVPKAGWVAWVEDEAALVVRQGSDWVGALGGSGANPETLGINASADTTNRLTVSADATLLNNDGAGHQLKLNKAVQSDTASLLFQTGFSGRAEMGTAGVDDFAIKVSADGASWNTALSADAATGQLSAPAGLTVTGQITGSAVQQDAFDTTQGRLLTVGRAFGLGLVTFTAESVADDMDATDQPVGAYMTINTTLGQFPTGSSKFGRMLVLRYNANEFVQIYNDILSDTVFTRRYRLAEGGFRPWRALYAAHNIVGAVAQAGGVPSGAVIEKGSNANGSYVRFADGTQRCTHIALSAPNASTADGPLFRSANLTWTYPSAFAAAPVVTGSVDDLDCWISTAAPGPGSCTLRARSSVTKAGALTIRAVAHGRWY